MKLIFEVIIFLTIFSCANRELLNCNTSVSAVSYSKNNGDSFKEAVVVYGVSSPGEGFAAEYQYISNLHGQRGQDWFLVGQTIIRENDKIIDVVEIKLNNLTDHRIFFFDASTFVSAN